jgi:hypothetical protein
MDKYIINMLKSLNPINDNKIKLLLNKGFRTGSTVFGGIKENENDIDIVIKIKDFSIEHSEIGIIYCYIYDCDYDGEGFRSYYCKTKKNNIINIILVDNENIYNEWKFATDVCILMYNTKLYNDIFLNKKLRIEFFELLKEFKNINLISKE